MVKAIYSSLEYTAFYCYRQQIRISFYFSIKKVCVIAVTHTSYIYVSYDL